ncbi:MAG: GAF domain-containing SpoIIE family protein phosphatase [Microscillaceae bacterium]|nr:GAF domain-containing SpoIIE family protein phosphatase [Microscillaceae bacterium]
MLSPKNALGIFLYVNIVSWLLLLTIKLIAFLGFSSQHVSNANYYLKGLLLNLFLLFIFFYFSSRVEKLKEINFVEILTRLFILGLVANTLSLIIQFVLSFLEVPPVSRSEEVIINILYHISIVLVMVFLTQAFFYWKKMVLHQKNEQLLKTWNAFEYLLLISLLFNFFEFDLNDLPFSIALGGLLLMGLFLSVNLKWVAYLNAKEKWQSILLLLFISIFSYYFFYTVIRHADIDFFTTNLMHSVYVLAMFVFVIFYSIFSLLVIIFNLPTTPVFQEINEVVVSLQRLVESLQEGEKEDQVYEVLLEKAYESVTADAGWLEIMDENGKISENILKGDISTETIQQIKRIIKKQRLKEIVEMTFMGKSISPDSRTYFNNHVQEAIKKFDFESIYIAPLVVNKDKPLGSLALLKKVKDGFDEEKRELINTFARQASISIEYFRLLSKKIEAERYKEEFKIAQRVQKSLLPARLEFGKGLKIEAFSESAYEVGGDYYDVYKTPSGKIMVIVGDVSGKGTSAAFHMSQMKGIFLSLAQLDLDTKKFLEYTNNALSYCLSKASFITITVMLIDQETKKVEFARAGHCPTIYYRHSEQKAHFHQGEGLGLGIIRNSLYAKHLESEIVEYDAGDMILLYTDGIVEAKNLRDDEYGYNRLKILLENSGHNTPAEILAKIKEDLRTFCSNIAPHDDYTAVLIKFCA